MERFSKKEIGALKSKGVFRASYSLFRAGIALLEKERRALILSAVSGLAIFLFFCGAALMCFALDIGPRKAVLFLQNGCVYFLCVFFTGFLAAFFSSAIMLIASERINGKKMSIGKAMSGVGKRFEVLFAWVFLAAAIETLGRMLASHGNALTLFFLAVLSLLWAFVVFYIVPAIIVGGGGLRESLRVSEKVIKKVWRETIIVGALLCLMALAFTAVVFAALFAFAVGSGPFPFSSPVFIAFACFMLLYGCFFAIFLHTLRPMLHMLLFRYAED